jgi:putative two-component system response regulator
VPTQTEDLKESDLLVVHREEEQLDELRRALVAAEFTEVRGTSDPTELLDLCRRYQPDVVLLDLDMELEDKSTVELLSELQEAAGRDFPVPAVIGVADGTGEDDLKAAVEWGVEAILHAPFTAIEVELTVRNRLETRSLRNEMEKQGGWLEGRAQERSAKVENAEMSVLHVLARLVEYRDFKTEQRSERVGELSARIASEMGLPDEDVQWLRDAAPLHDVGMVVVPDRILLKQGELDEDERRIMTTHTTNGARILSESDLPVMQLAKEIAHTHHERWDGEGYPRGLARTEIPLAGRIVAVADAYDAMTHDRPFRDAASHDEALVEIENQGGKQFDPRVVESFLELMERERDTQRFMEMMDRERGGGD